MTSIINNQEPLDPFIRSDSTYSLKRSESSESLIELDDEISSIAQGSLPDSPRDILTLSPSREYTIISPSNGSDLQSSTDSVTDSVEDLSDDFFDELEELPPSSREITLGPVPEALSNALLDAADKSEEVSQRILQENSILKRQLSVMSLQVSSLLDTVSALQGTVSDLSHHSQEQRAIYAFKPEIFHNENSALFANELEDRLFKMFQSGQVIGSGLVKPIQSTQYTVAGAVLGQVPVAGSALKAVNGAVGEATRFKEADERTRLVRGIVNPKYLTTQLATLITRTPGLQRTIDEICQRSSKESGSRTGQAKEQLGKTINFVSSSNKHTPIQTLADKTATSIYKSLEKFKGVPSSNPLERLEQLFNTYKREETGRSDFYRQLKNHPTLEQGSSLRSASGVISPPVPPRPASRAMAPIPTPKSPAVRELSFSTIGPKSPPIPPRPASRAVPPIPTPKSPHVISGKLRGFTSPVNNNKQEGAREEIARDLSNTIELIDSYYN